MSWYEAIKDAANAIDKLKNAEATAVMATVRMEGAKLAEENARLRDEVRELREALRIRDAMAWDENAYWIERDGRREGPYCPRCQDADRKAVRMLDRGHDWKCSTCTTVVRKPGAGSYDQPDDFPPPYEPIR